MTELKTYEGYGNKDLSELAKLWVEYDSPRQWAQLGYEEKLMELKHQVDLKLLQEQAKITKLNNWIIVIATMLAILLGVTIQFILQRCY